MRNALQYSNRFQRQYKKLLRSDDGRALLTLQRVITLLAEDAPLPLHCQNHRLVGALKGFSECHILPDWLLIYQIDERETTLRLLATGKHSELFK